MYAKNYREPTQFRCMLKPVYVYDKPHFDVCKTQTFDHFDSGQSTRLRTRKKQLQYKYKKSCNLMLKIILNHAKNHLYL